MEQFPNWAAGSISVGSIGLLTWLIKRIVWEHGKQRKEDRERFLLEIRRTRRTFARELDRQRAQCRDEAIRMDALWSNHVAIIKQNQAEIVSGLKEISENLHRQG